jgi:hypothetical protein
MNYSLEELLMKMGAPETKEKGFIRWHYFDAETGGIAGFAEVRLLDGGKSLVAEMRHPRQDGRGGAEAPAFDIAAGRGGGLHEECVESFYLHAQKTGARYKVTKIAFDGDDYSAPQKSIVELGLSIFHARALDISILMVEQSFNKQDILRPPEAESAVRLQPPPVGDTFRKEAWGIVVPFRPRQQARVNLS